MRNRLNLKLQPLPQVILLILIVTLGSLAIGNLVKTNPYIKIFDQYFYELLSRHFHSRAIDLIIAPFNFNFLPTWMGPLPSFQYLMILLGLIALWIWKKELVKWYLLSLILGMIIAYLVTVLDLRLVFRQRPFAILPNDVSEIGRQAWQNLSSFPSGHTRETTWIGTIMVHYLPRLKWLMILFIVFICLSRVYVGAHYPTDVIAGVLIGYLAGKIALLITQQVRGKFYENR